MRDREDCDLEGPIGRLLKASFVRMLSWPEFSLICGGFRGGGEELELDMIARNE